MNKLIIGFAMVFGLFQTSAFATDGHHVRGILGFTQGALNIGADYENRKGAIGYGGYLYMSDDEDKISKYGILAIGGNVTVHVFENSNFDVYLAPGFGIAKIENPAAGGDDETTFGPSFKTGVEYNFTGQFALGLQHLYIYNWLSDETIAGHSALNVTGTFHF